MSFQTGSIDKNGLARTEDGKLYVTSVGTAAITGGSANLDAGASNAPTLTWGGDTTTGLYRPGANSIGLTISSTVQWRAVADLQRYRSAMVVGWASGAADSTNADTGLARNGAGVVEVNNGTAGSFADLKAAIITAAAGTATPANGSTAARLLFGTTAGFGIYYGSGAPTVSAAQGSVYMRSDGSTTSSRMYINTNGTNGWTTVTTAT
jgi:hypothetical protein